MILPTCMMLNIRESLSSQCSAVGDLTASSRTIHPGKLTRWIGRPRTTGTRRIVGVQVTVKTIYPSMRSIRPAVYKMNSGGPRTDCCCTPNSTIFCVATAEPRLTHSTLFVRYDWNQSSAASLIPKETLSRVSRMSWSTVSNAADRSSKARTDRSPSSTAYRMSVSTFSTAVSVEWWVRYAVCRRGRRSAVDRYSCRAVGKRCAQEAWTTDIS